jgi:asparagine synthase (glutamine-hydrolysing)
MRTERRRSGRRSGSIDVVDGSRNDRIGSALQQKGYARGNTPDRPVDRVLDLTEPSRNRLYNMTLDQARERLARGSSGDVRSIDGSFALVARDGFAVRMARSLDRPLRYFLAKRSDGPMLVVADRIDTIHACLRSYGIEEQFQPSYTRMVPAHYVVEIRLVGCPDPEPTYTRFFTPSRDVLPPDLDEIGGRYIGAVADEIAKWLRTIPPEEPIGICFSGGVDSGAVFLVTQHVLRSLGMSPSRLKAFTLSIRGGEDLAQARLFLESLGFGFFLEPVEADAKGLDSRETVRVIEDYKPLDVESATMALALCRGIRERYPGWRHLVDGDGGDENLKDYPIEENSELTIRSVLSNPLLYQEGWGVGTVKHSLTYSGGQSRSYTRTYAPLTRYGFEGFSPFTRSSVVEVAEGIPFVSLTDWEPERLYSLKGEHEITSCSWPRARATKLPTPTGTGPTSTTFSSARPSRPERATSIGRRSSESKSGAVECSFRATAPESGFRFLPDWSSTPPAHAASSPGSSGSARRDSRRCRGPRLCTPTFAESAG